MGDDTDETLFAELISSAGSIEEQVESIQIQNQIWDAMQKLSPRQRAVIIQRYFLEMSEKEMAAESGAAVGTTGTAGVGAWLLIAVRKTAHAVAAMYGYLEHVAR